MTKEDENKKLIVGLDIGTSKIVAIVAELQADNSIEVVGLGQHVSRGLKKGVVVDIELTVQSVQRALEEAELMADCKVEHVFSGISGSHIKSYNSHGMVKIRDGEVTQYDVDYVIETAKAMSLPADQEILHCLTQEFEIDGQNDVRSPLGMSGKRLDVRVHIVSGAITAAENILKCIKRCGVEPVSLSLQPLASGKAVLTEDERELGVCLVDIGGGTTDIAVYKNGTIRHTAVLPIAGDQMTNDIAVAFRTRTATAEEIKIQHGCAHTKLADSREMIEVAGVDDREPRELAATTLSDILEQRIAELYKMVISELQKSGLEQTIAAGVVITGGASMMKGMIELGEEVFEMPVRVGLPKNVGGLSEVVSNPRYATGVGLLMIGQEQVVDKHSEALEQNGFSRAVSAMKSWFQSTF